MKYVISFSLLCIVGLISMTFLGCSSTVSDQTDQPELNNLEFSQSTYAPSDALVLRATPNPDLGEKFFNNNTLSIQLSTSSGDEASAQISPFSDLTDAEMVEAIKEGADNTAILRIKETDQESARNSDGELIRSEEAINSFVNWTENREEITVTRKAALHPNVLIQFTTDPTVDVVSEVRTHGNVEFMEPNAIGEFHSVPGDLELSGNLTLVILSGGTLTYQSGDTVTAEFRQADGTILQATVNITE